VKIWFDGGLEGWDVREPFKKRSSYDRIVRFEVLGSFCNFVCGGEGRDVLAERSGKARLNNGICLKGLEFLEAAVEASLDAGLVAGEPVELVLEVVVGKEILVGGLAAELGFHAADAAKIPGCGYQLVEQSLLDSALGFDVGLVIG
jgi:hypothetical protein